MRRNPFYENGQVVGEGYIGRHEEIRNIMRILSQNSKNGSIVVSGLTRMGKTSLVKNCFDIAEKNNLLEKNNIVTLSVTVSTVNDFSQFYKRISNNLYMALEDRNLLDSILERRFSKIEVCLKNKDEDLIYELDDSFRAILNRLSKKGIKTVALLDEFDDARRAFKYDGVGLSTNFQKFRDYVTEADYNITFILTSRTDISVIDASLPSGSNLRGAFSEISLTGFTDDEREEFFEKIRECGVTLSPEQKKKYIWYAGRSPFLFSKIASRIMMTDESLRSEDISISRIVKQCKRDFEAYFDSLIGFMTRDELLSKYIQVFFGPVYDLSKKDIELLKQYGYIYRIKDDLNFRDMRYFDKAESDLDDVYTYQTLSEYFLEFVRIMVNRDDSLIIWKELIDAEKALRGVVEQGLKKTYGPDNWMTTLKEIALNRTRGFLFDVNKADTFMKASRMTFGDRVDDNLLAMISIDALGNIIKAYWNECYHTMFNPPYEELTTLIRELEQLNKVRNPLAHGAENYLSTEDKVAAENYCKKINYVCNEKNSKKRKK